MGEMVGHPPESFQMGLLEHVRSIDACRQASVDSHCDSLLQTFPVALKQLLKGGMVAAPRAFEKSLCFSRVSCHTAPNLPDCKGNFSWTQKRKTD